MSPLPSRQVHLDFHTSEHIPDVGARFNKRQWQAALKTARINSITVFAKCHHGWSYYPTRVGQPHPTLTRNLLQEQIAACHAIGVRCPIYFTVGWSARDAEQHPEWIVRQADGTPAVLNVDLRAAPENPRPPCSWIFLFPARAYLELILRQTEEICREFEVDGFFYDICFGPLDYSADSRREMAEQGLDPENPDDVRAYHRQVWLTLMERCNAVIHAHHPRATVFYNGAATMEQPAWHPYQTHFELEDLPTTWGGYDKFPLRARYFANTGRPYVAVSGKFHTMWGEFGGFKHPDAIRFEAAAMIAFGARCSFGDQLHPAGELDSATYRNLGLAYRYVQRIESYGLDGEPCSNLALLLTGGRHIGEHGVPAPAHDQGVANMLLEGQVDFRVAPPDGDWTAFRTLILTGGQCLDEKLAAKLQAFVARGGNLLVLYASALDGGHGRFLLDIGADYAGPAQYDVDYLVAGRRLARGLVASPFLNYSPALRVRPHPGVEVLASLREPYFSRTYGHYCSHQNTPYRLEDAPHPAALRKGRVIYLAHPLGEMYTTHGARLHRQYFLNALRLVHTRPVLDVRMPSAGRVSLLHQPNKHRYVLHLLYGPPLQRGRCSVIEDLVPLYDLPVRLRVPERIRRVTLPLEKHALRRRTVAGALAVTIPRVQMHQIVVFEY